MMSVGSVEWKTKIERGDRLARQHADDAVSHQPLEQVAQNHGVGDVLARKR